MKTLILIVIISTIFSALLADPKQSTTYNDEQVNKQKKVLYLFKYINQPSCYPEHIEIAKQFDYKSPQHYTNPTVLEEFVEIWKYGFLPKGEIFSIYHNVHKEQVRALFKIFYYAKDFETFYNLAVWARANVNEGMFLYTYSVAVALRDDTNDFMIPPIYELNPNYFFNSETIKQAQYYKQIYQPGKQNIFYIQYNYTNEYLNLHSDQSLSYFLEDIGLNSFYYYYNVAFPFWLDGEKFHIRNEKKGEVYHLVHKYLVTRYYLERISNGFGEIPSLNWEVPLETLYYPSLQYNNGLQFPSRPKFVNLYDYFYNYGQKVNFVNKYGYSYTYIKDYERRISDAIDSGFVLSESGEKMNIYTNEGFGILTNIILGNPYIPYYKYYGDIMEFSRHLLGYSSQPLDNYKLMPSALEHFETSLRDPVFYQLYKKIMFYFTRYQSPLPSYTEKDLYHPEINIENVDISELQTYFKEYTVDISSAVYVTPEEFINDTFQVFVKQYRLNNKPFTIKINLESSRVQKADIKIFLGPKYDEYGRYMNLSQNHMNFFLMDYFTQKLTKGSNNIIRKSGEMHFTKSFNQSFKDMLVDLENGEGFQASSAHSLFSLPQNLLLPKGSKDGMEFQFFIFAYPLTWDMDLSGKYHYGHRWDFPLNHHIKFEEMWYNIPNAYFMSKKIYHVTN